MSCVAFVREARVRCDRRRATLVACSIVAGQIRVEIFERVDVRVVVAVKVLTVRARGVAACFPRAKALAKLSESWRGRGVRCVGVHCGRVHCGRIHGAGVIIAAAGEKHDEDWENSENFHWILVTPCTPWCLLPTEGSDSVDLDACASFRAFWRGDAGGRNSGMLMAMGEPPQRPARVRLSLPAWLEDWPRGLRPEAAYLDSGRVEFLYRAPNNRWFLVGLWPPARVSEGWGPDAADLTRLSGALEYRLRRSSDAVAWLRKMVRFHRSLLALPSFGGRRRYEALEPIDELLQRSVGIRASREASPAVGSFPPSAAGRAKDLRIALRLASGDFEEALAEASGAATATNQAADVRTALVASLEGRVDDARRAALQASEHAGAAGAFSSAQLLEWLGHAREAIECLSTSVALVESRPKAAFERARRITMMAAPARRRPAAGPAAARMEKAAASEAEWRACAEAWIEAGEFEKAERVLWELLPSESPMADGAGVAAESTAEGGDDARVMLATLLVWRGAAGEAAGLLRRRIERAPSPEMLRTLGAAEYLLGDLPKSLEHFESALELDSEDHQARLWRAEVLGALGKLDAACDAVREVSLGDQVAWQLVRAYVEEQHAPGRRSAGDTWFIVDALLRPLLGEDAPPAAPTHEEAVTAMRGALKLLGGNRSVTPTTVRKGKLRWEDELRSPRRRAELLQESLLHRPIRDVLAEFAELATAHPKVPFYQTYAAELSLWLGDYEHAYEWFGRLWRDTRTRWGYVGAGAAAFFFGDDERALALWREGLEHYTYLEAEATYCYRGELYLARGDLQAAEADLTRATQAQPARLGAWIDLALLHYEQDQAECAASSTAHVKRLAPAFWFRAQQQSSSAAEALSKLRGMMRGNRASGMYSLVDETGELRVVGTGAPARVAEAAKKQLSVLEDGLLAELAARSADE